MPLGMHFSHIIFNEKIVDDLTQCKCNS